MKTLKSIIIFAIMMVAFVFILGECESGWQQIQSALIGIGLIIMDTYLWQWFGMDKYYGKFLNED